MLQHARIDAQTERAEVGHYQNLEEESHDQMAENAHGGSIHLTPNGQLVRRHICGEQPGAQEGHHVRYVRGAV